MTRYDAIVLGVGGMGSAALWHLARRGRRVLGIEQFDIAHDRGSSHGGSRLIRRAYFEHPDYVPLVSRAYAHWDELERASGVKLFHRTGLYLAGRRPGPVIDGVLRAATAHQLDIHTLSPADAARRFPGLRSGPDMTVLYEPDAGFLEVENCVRTHVQLALAAGAKVHSNEPVQGWSAGANGVEVQTNRGRYTAARLVVCGGAWSGRILADLDLPLVIRRKVVAWYESRPPGYRVGPDCPVFCFDTPDGFFYGFPTPDGRTIKIGEHTGGRPIAAPDALDRVLHETDVAPLARFIEAHLPASTTRVIEHSVCMYTMTPDEHFIIDRHPNHANVFLACGFSGHGFKFGSVVGSILADWVTRDNTDECIEFLSLKRFSLRMP
jgi:monomeric sarcosine oxidase